MAILVEKSRSYLVYFQDYGLLTAHVDRGQNRCLSYHNWTMVNGFAYVIQFG
jgi:hypothetical protein